MSPLVSRRGLMAGLAGSAIPTAARALTANPDAQLLALCNQFQELAVKLDQLVEMPAGFDPGYRQILNVLNSMDFVDPAITSVPARTIAGMRAKAEIASWSRHGNLNVDNNANLDERMAWSIVRDIIQLREKALV